LGVCSFTYVSKKIHNLLEQVLADSLGFQPHVNECAV
jgi:hypothetical protein